jgi:hypothetical protein
MNSTKVVSQFLNIYTSRKNSSKFASKLIYKGILKSLNPETDLPAAQPRGPPRATRSMRSRPTELGPRPGRPARASTLCKRDPKLVTNNATNYALFPHSETLQKHPPKNSSSQLSGPRHPSARRRGSGRHWPVTPARGRSLPRT